MHKIYLDNAATTKPLDLLKDIYADYAGSAWQNPSALYLPAVNAKRRLMESSSLLLSAFGGESHRCLFTSGGTEGANMVVFRGAKNKKGMNYVCGGLEHPCVDECFRQLTQSGADVRFVATDQAGAVLPEKVADAVDSNTALVSIIHVNNETGAKNDIEAIASLVKAKNQDVLFFSDGVQAFMREPLADVSNIDYYTVSAHKLHAHKGTGALFFSKDAPLKPFFWGGGQQNGLRSGTENTLGIFSFAKAVEYHRDNTAKLRSGIRKINAAFVSALNGLEGVRFLTPDGNQGCAHIVTLAFEGVNGETLLHALEAKGINISNGSACSSKKGKNRLRAALRLPDTIANGVIRVSFSIYNTVEDAETAAFEIKKTALKLRQYTRG